MLWWALIVLRGVLPVVFAITIGVLVTAVKNGDSLAMPLTVSGAVFIVLQMLTPLHVAVSANVGSKTSAWLNDRLTTACVGPPGMAHLERPELTDDLTMARDFDLGISGPPLTISMDFIASGLVELASGIAAAVVLARFHWWAPLLVGGAWLSTHVLLRESSVWRDRNTDEVMEAQRHADYAYRLAVDPPAAKEIRLFGLAGWTVERFTSRRRRLLDLQWHATRLRERSVVWCLLLIVAANGLVFWAIAHDASNGAISLGAAVVYAQTAVGASALAVGGFSWALAFAAQPVAAVLRLEEAMRPVGALAAGHAGRGGHAGARCVLSRCELRVRSERDARAGRIQPDDSGRDVDRDRRTERRGQDDAREAALPPLRSGIRNDRSRRRRSAATRPRGVARSRDGGLPGLHPLRADAARERSAARRAR